MLSRPVRFIHSGDFHLDQPLHGAAEVPDHLRELFRDAPFRAAERVFDAVLAQRAEFLVLAGNLLEAKSTGPRGTLFLVRQFERLQAAGVAVYWAGGQTDPPEDWPAEIPLPDNVRVFPSGRSELWTHSSDDAPPVRIVGQSQRRRKLRAADFAEAGAGPADGFSVAVAHAEADPAAVEPAAISYWALGGRSSRKTLPGKGRSAHYAGSPQGRSPKQAGPHGCTLVELVAGKKVQLSSVACDAARWHAERIEVAAGTTLADLESRLHERLQAVQAANAGVDLLVTWHVQGEGRALVDLRRGTRAADVLQGLRRQFGYSRPAAWSVALEIEPPPAALLSAGEQPTLRNEFLRVAAQFFEDDDEKLDFGKFLAPLQAGDEAEQLLEVSGPAARDRVLRQAAALGMELLSGEDASR